MKKFSETIYRQLKNLYSENEIRNFSYMIAEKITGLSYSQIVFNKNIIFSPNLRIIADAFIDKLKNKLPIQYILGETEFYGLKFNVNENVLIPRPETEELVEWIISDHKNSLTLKTKILDIGTGSGAIAVTLKHILKNAEIDAFDISADAIKLANKNAELNNTSVLFSQVDILNAPQFDKKWDLIISNPPYIPENEKETMDENVLDHEPHIALFVPKDDDLLFYRKIALFAGRQMNEGGKIYFEIHHKAGNRIVELLSTLNFKNIVLRKDISGNDRMIRAEI